jgi:RecB family exonuclease
LRGRADLQVETSAGKICIFDYKTGAVNYPKVKRYLNQLIFYETLYYLLDDPQKQEVLDSAIYFIEAKELKRKKKNDLDVKTELENMVETILEKGYPLLAKKAEYEDVDITRRDRAELQEQEK